MRAVTLAPGASPSLGVSSAPAFGIRVASFNFESDGADPSVADDLFEAAGGIDDGAFTEERTTAPATGKNTAAEARGGVRPFREPACLDEGRAAPGLSTAPSRIRRPAGSLRPGCRPGDGGGGT